MTPTEMRVALAEARGWTVMTEQGSAYLWRDNKRFHVCTWLRDRPATLSDFQITPFLPDYLSDLNACHAIEVELFGAEQKHFRHALVDICQTPEDAISATAQQRTEALLRVLRPEVFRNIAGQTAAPKSSNLNP